MTVLIVCPCGEQHEFGELASEYLARCIVAFGPSRRVEVVGCGVWAVSRVYLAAHTVYADELPGLATRYGFGRVAPWRNDE